MRALLCTMILPLMLLMSPAEAAATPAPPAIMVCEAVWLDAARERQVPVRIRMPVGTGKLGLIIFSHGLGGSLDAGAIWAHAWAEAGFAVINVQHHGSDSAIFGKRGFRSALNGEELVKRARDVHFVLDEVDRKPSEGACDLMRIDRNRIGVAGHSFGAQTIQAIAGQSFAAPVEPSLADPRVRAAVGFSPSPPVGESAEGAFATIHIPFLSITGTEDAVPYVSPITALQRRRPFRYMPPGEKYLLVLNGGTHEMFAGQNLASILNGAPPPHVRELVIACTTAFWRATLDGDREALHWLQGAEGFRMALAPGDIFENR